MSFSCPMLQWLNNDYVIDPAYWCIADLSIRNWPWGSAVTNGAISALEYGLHQRKWSLIPWREEQQRYAKQCENGDMKTLHGFGSLFWLFGPEFLDALVIEGLIIAVASWLAVRFMVMVELQSYFGIRILMPCGNKAWPAGKPPLLRESRWK